MRLRVAWIQPRGGRQKSAEAQRLAEEYGRRLGKYVALELQPLAKDFDLVKSLEKEKGRTSPYLVLLDSEGKQLSSQDLAGFLRRHMEQGTQQLVFAVGGPDGFSEPLRSAASFVLSLGAMTLPHELARVVLLEQLYRAFTILKGHPYHSGH